MTKTFLLVVTVAAGFGLGGSFQAAAETRKASGDRPLESRRYETLRGLARHLDETAQGGLGGTADVARRRTPSETRFLSSLRSFARRAHDFRTTIDDHPPSAAEVPARVHDLITIAHQVDDRIRATRALAGTYDDWEAILDVLERMRLLLTGHDVEMPRPRGRRALGPEPPGVPPAEVRRDGGGPDDVAHDAC
jgi:hypothetical protein